MSKAGLSGSVASSGEELHLIILWQNGAGFTTQLLQDLHKNFELVGRYPVAWDRVYFSRNLSKFYGQKLNSTSEKTLHIGTGAFEIFLVLDKEPAYQIRKTSRGHALVNTRIFDLKERFRSLMGGGSLIHATNDLDEFRRDFCLLFGCNIDDSRTLDAHSFSPLKKLPGVGGWRNMSEIFMILNNCDDYVVMRNFENLPDDLKNTDHGDIDILSRNWTLTKSLLSADMVFSEKNRRHVKVKMCDGSEIKMDLRDIGDNYYDPIWACNILENKTLSPKNISVPDSENLHHMIIYHALLHKHYLSSDYAIGGKELSWVERFERLSAFMKKNSYCYPIPTDRSVGYDKRYTPLGIRAVELELKKLNIYEVKPYMVELWKNRFSTQYFTGVFDGQKVFIKFGGVKGSARREYEILKKFINHGIYLFQDPVLFSEHGNNNILALPFIEGESLAKCLNRQDLTASEIKCLDFYLAEVVRSFKEFRIIHRDVRPENIIRTLDGKFLLIDFQMAISLKDPIFKEYKFFHKNARQVKNLGGEYQYGRYIWNDQFSINKMKIKYNGCIKNNSLQSHMTWYGKRNTILEKFLIKTYNHLRWKV